MGMWRSFKQWMKFTLLRMLMRIVRTRLYKYTRKIVRASIVPLSVTAGAAGIGACVASAVAFPVVYGALIGAGAGVVTVITVKCWARHVEAERARIRAPTTFSVLKRKEKHTGSSSRGTFVVASPSSSSSGRMR